MESLEDRLDRERREFLKRTTPMCCPKCGSTDLHYHMAEWFAHSLEEHDLHNTAELAEHQCEGCGAAFWL